MARHLGLLGEILESQGWGDIQRPRRGCTTQRGYMYLHCGGGSRLSRPPSLAHLIRAHSACCRKCPGNLPDWWTRNELSIGRGMQIIQGSVWGRAWPRRAPGGRYRLPCGHHLVSALDGPRITFLVPVGRSRPWDSCFSSGSFSHGLTTTHIPLGWSFPLSATRPECRRGAVGVGGGLCPEPPCPHLPTRISPGYSALRVQGVELVPTRVPPEGPSV